MPCIKYCTLGLASCLLYEALLAFGFWNTDPESGWHALWAILFIATSSCAAECIILIVICAIRQWMGYDVDMIGEKEDASNDVQ